MLAIGGQNRLTPGALQYMKREHLGIEPLGISRFESVAAVIQRLPAEELLDHPVDDRRIFEWVVRRNAYDDICLETAGGLVEPIQHVAAAARVCGDVVFRCHSKELAVRWLCSGR